MWFELAADLVVGELRQVGVRVRVVADVVALGDGALPHRLAPEVDVLLERAAGGEEAELHALGLGDVHRRVGVVGAERAPHVVDGDGDACAWFVGPVRIHGGQRA